MRARLALAVSAQVCELREVVLRDKPPELLQASPKATVPVLIDEGGRVIDQSLDIMLWALRHNDPGQWLRPERADLETMLALIAEFDDGFKYHLDRYKYAGRHDDADGAAAPAHRAQAAVYLDRLNAQLLSTPHLFGERAALADMALAPFVRQFAQTDTGWFAQQPWAPLQAWLSAFVNSALYGRIMQKYPKWESGTAGVSFPPDP
ncbi:glutathione S-transferase [Polaromonas sp. C04]|nr:glutathione S-transferase [Polaromonas sp. C04]